MRADNMLLNGELEPSGLGLRCPSQAPFSANFSMLAELSSLETGQRPASSKLLHRERNIVFRDNHHQSWQPLRAHLAMHRIE